MQRNGCGCVSISTGVRVMRRARSATVCGHRQAHVDAVEPERKVNERNEKEEQRRAVRRAPPPTPPRGHQQEGLRDVPHCTHTQLAHPHREAKRVTRCRRCLCAGAAVAHARVFPFSLVRAGVRCSVWDATRVSGGQQVQAHTATTHTSHYIGNAEGMRERERAGRMNKRVNTHPRKR